MPTATYVFDANSLREIESAVPCKVFVTGEACDGQLRVTATSTSSPEALDNLHVVQKGDRLCLKWQPSLSRLTPTSLLIEIVADYTVFRGAKITNNGSGGLYLHHLPVAANLSLRQNGFGKIQLNALELSLGRLNCYTSGSGCVEVEAMSLNVDRLTCSTSGSGATKCLVAAVTADTIDCHIAGSGVVYFASAKALTATELVCRVAGSGTVAVAGAGSTKHLDINVAGSGCVHSDALVAHEVDVAIAGSGIVTIQAANNLKSNVMGSGVVRCVTPVPRSVAGKVTFIDSPGPMPTYPSSPLPDREPEFCTDFRGDDNCCIM
ncbi:hypothetical protein ACHHYP_06688 [Achlya hypogyna]|uniref:Putative auto-transporter adhesin head GIN domain-containing protein n=1 Tax=Achlya hypogyna TaxID=1202772 RepID=A0A1V9YSG6_ACHHY|nr:hypothetical protein ACHHYP_06688 [Achlya hypogyna]